MGEFLQVEGCFCAHCHDTTIKASPHHRQLLSVLLEPVLCPPSPPSKTPSVLWLSSRPPLWAKFMLSFPNSPGLVPRLFINVFVEDDCVCGRGQVKRRRGGAERGAVSALFCSLFVSFSSLCCLLFCCLFVVLLFVMLFCVVSVLMCFYLFVLLLLCTIGSEVLFIVLLFCSLLFFSVILLCAVGSHVLFIALVLY